jgi:hypothetical protein
MNWVVDNCQRIEFEDEGIVCFKFPILHFKSELDHCRTKRVKVWQSRKENSVTLSVDRKFSDYFFKSLCNFDYISKITSYTFADHLQRFLTEHDALFSLALDEGPSESSECGLFSELVFLDVLLLKDPLKYETWKGYLKTQHDFVFLGSSLEIKSSLSNHASFFSVSNASQVIPSKQNRPLFIAFFSLEKNPENGKSIWDICASIEERFSEKVCMDVRNNIAKLGFLNDKPEVVRKFRVRDVRFFKVGKGFPHFDAVPNGIFELKYKIDVNCIADFSVDSFGGDVYGVPEIQRNDFSEY